MDAAAELGRKPVSKHQIQPEYGDEQAESGAYLRDSSRVPRRRPYETDGVNCRESAGTGPVNLKVVPNGCCLGRSPWTN